MRTVPRLALLRAPALLLLWQTAPVKVDFSDAGRIRVAVGFSAGVYQDQQLDCAGNVISRANVKHSSVGGQVEGWVTPNIRVAAAGGVWSGSSDSSWATVAKGGYGQGVIAWEGDKIGLGVGLVSYPTSAAQTAATMYARVGRLDKVHVRFDGMESAAPGIPAPFRFSVAKGYGPKMGEPRWAVGIANLHPGAQEGIGVFGELGLAGGRIQPLFTGWANPGAPNWGVGIGLRVGLGSTPH